MSRARTWFAIALALTLLGLAIGPGSGEQSEPDDSTVAGGPSVQLPDNMSIVEAGYRPLNVRLSEGAPTLAEVDDSVVADGEPLTDQQIQAILDRVGGEPLQGTTSEFERPAETLAPPLVAENIEQTFPPAGTSSDTPDVPEGPLQVLRYTPEGAVDIAPFITVVFNQPMVPVATLDQLDDVEVPISIEPAIEGKWQWIGTNIARFDHTSDVVDRLPMATSYTVTIPAGTTSQTGGALGETVSFGFQTPPARVVQLTPSDEQLRTTPVFVATFDQLVDPTAILAVTSVTAAGAPVKVRLATDEEIAADEQAQRQTGSSPDGRWVAFTPTSPMPTDAPVVIDFGPDLPSAEGSLTNDLQRFTARTYPPLRYVRLNCWWDGCPPQSPWGLEFSTQLDIEAFDPAWVSVSPEVPGLRAVADWQNITITGAFTKETTYRVTIDAALADVFGQTLGEDLTVEVRVNSPRPQLHQIDQQIVTIDPYTDTPTIEISSVEHDELRVTVFDRTADQWSEYRGLLDDRYSEQWKLPDWPGAFTRTIDVERGEGYVDVTSIDLSDALGDGPGHVVVVVEPVRRITGDDRWDNRPIVAWVQRTDIGIDAFATPGAVVVWATDLATGSPIEGADVRLTPSGRQGSTDAEGLVDIDISGNQGYEYEGLVLATVGSDTALLPHWGWDRNAAVDRLVWHTFTDRGIYRPGETMRLKGWVRNLTLSGNAQIELFDSGSNVAYTVWDPQGNELASGTTALSSLGGFDLAVDIPAGSNLGYAWLDLSIPGRDSYGTQFRIEEFRRPEFEVRTWPDSPGPYLLTQPATVGVEAEYYSGGPLSDSLVEWRVSTSDASYSPPGHDEFHFGVWTPWWWYGGIAEGGGFNERIYGDEYFIGPGFGSPDVETFVGRTNAAGQHYLRLDFFDGTDDLPSTVSAQATVYDVNRQSVASSTDLLVHPAQWYVGLRSPANFVRPGETLEIETLVVDIDGAVVSGAGVSIELARTENRYVGGEWVDVAIDPETCDVVSSSDPVVCSFTPVVGGTYRVKAVVTDEAGRT
ncbi:MAG: hypothetical protein KDB16_12320, partial [Acidimicrobiales bacterium]|nr:hypothetical protein [Acidimicrobiales bacterium]